MKKHSLIFSILLFSTFYLPQPTLAAPSVDAAYQYAYSLYAANNFTQAKQYYLYVVLNGSDPEIKANSLYLLAQCYLQLGDYNNCVKAANMLAGGYPHSSIVQKGILTNFSTNLIGQIANIQADWDYWRYRDGSDDDGKPVWKESVPVGKRIKRIDFKLAFGLYHVLKTLNPDSQATADAKKQLQTMLSTPITILWVDEKAAPNRYGHPADFFSLFTKNEKKDFSKSICERMFYDWKTDKLYEFMDMYDDVRNLKPRYTARTQEPADDQTAAAPLPAVTPSASDANAPGLPPPPPLADAAKTGAAPVTTGSSAAPLPSLPSDVNILTLAKLFQAAAYDPYSDTFSNPAEAAPAAPSL